MLLMIARWCSVLTMMSLAIAQKELHKVILIVTNEAELSMDMTKAEHLLELS